MSMMVVMPSYVTYAVQPKSASTEKLAAVSSIAAAVRGPLLVFWYSPRSPAA